MSHESWKEISTQAEALRQTYFHLLNNNNEVRGFLDKPGDIVFMGCGSSYWLSMAGSHTFSLYTGRKSCAVKAGEIVMNPDEYASRFENPILICPSRSGRSTEQLEAIRIIRETYGEVPVLSIVEYEDTELEKLAELTIRLPWANEVSICQTRSFSCLYLAVVMITAIISGSNVLADGILRYLDAAPGLHERGWRAIAAIVDSFPSLDYLVVLGSGRQYGVAIEGAYIGIEMAQLKACYYSVLELRHGPIVSVNSNTLVALLSNGKARALEENMAADARRQGGKLLVVADRGEFINADWMFDAGGDYPSEAIALYFIFLMQVFAYRQAVRNGLDPDRPGNLVPYITIST
jgi:glucosamine--fructose-6-phosphate aminotransferase (isomerizing)